MDPIPSSSSAVEREQPPAPPQDCLLIKADHKDFYLNRVFGHHRKSFGLVFVRKRETALRLAESLSFGPREAYAVFNGSAFDREFDLEMYEIRKREKEFIDPMALVITERGAQMISDDDFPTADIVVNYDIPSDSEYYIPSIGRATQPGKGVMLALSLATHTAEDYVKVEKMIGDSELPPYFTEEDRPDLFRRFRVGQKLALDALTYGRFETQKRAQLAREALRIF